MLERAEFGGTELPKLDGEILARTLNACLKLFGSDALALIRDEKVSAVHSDAAVDYSVLSIDKLLKILQSNLDARFPENEFELATAATLFPLPYGDFRNRKRISSVPTQNCLLRMKQPKSKTG